MEKPYPSFQLTPHPTGQWCKKIHGKIVYFGKDPTIAGTYREHITDDRLLTVVNFVRTWLLK